jgi:hypothetical protein
VNVNVNVNVPVPVPVPEKRDAPTHVALTPFSHPLEHFEFKVLLRPHGSATVQIRTNKPFQDPYQRIFRVGHGQGHGHVHGGWG